jgi:hypothetical protein
MSRAADILEQDVGGGEGDNLPTYENLAQAHGPNSRYDFRYCCSGAQHSVLVVQVRQVEELGREEVTFIARIYFEQFLTLFQRAAERYVDVTPEELERRRRRGWGEGIADVRVLLHISFLTIS